MFKIIRRDNFSPIFNMFDEFFRNPSFEENKNISEEENVSGMPLDFVESSNEYRIIANLPGISKEDVKLSLDQNQLFIEAIRKKEEVKDSDIYHHRERFYGNYKRMINLPDHVDKENIKAKMNDGVLELIINKEERLPRKEIIIE